jgi:hypothetical protein
MLSSLTHTYEKTPNVLSVVTFPSGESLLHAPHPLIPHTGLWLSDTSRLQRELSGNRDQQKPKTVTKKGCPFSF